MAVSSSQAQRKHLLLERTATLYGTWEARNIEIWTVILDGCYKAKAEMHLLLRR